MKPFKSTLVLVLALAFVACNTQTPPAPNPGDTTPPSIVSISPNEGAMGVAKDVVIVVKFSEAMNKGATELAYGSSDIPAVNFSWNADATELSIDPAGDLSYTDPGKVYTFSIGSSATDLAGNKLTTVASSFTTLRQITAQFYSVAALDGNVRSDGVLLSGSCGSTLICVGDSGLVDNSTYRGFISFDLSSLPEALTQVVAAELRVEQAGLFGTPYTDLGSLRLDHVNYGASLSAADFDAPVLASLGILSTTTALEFKTKSVTASVQDDWSNRAARGHRSQYRLRFFSLTDGDGAGDYATFTPGEAASSKPRLEVTYLIP